MSATAPIFLLFLAALAGSAGAAAADMGPTSRGTIAISVTVAPHVMIRPQGAETPLAVSAHGAGLCVEANGFTRYHVALVRRSGATGEGEDVRLDPRPAERSGCAPGAAALPPLPARIAGQQASSGQILTLLIVPD